MQLNVPRDRGDDLTWQVMAAPRADRYLWVMSTTTAIAPSSLRPLTLVAAAILAVFGVFSTWVVATQGYFGFLELAGREWWALQMLIDLVIGLAFAAGWMIGDARKRQITAWPYLVVTVFLGSIGILAYVVRRGFTREVRSSS
jgi:hypothetical protein